MREVHQDLEPESNLKSDFRLGFLQRLGCCNPVADCGSSVANSLKNTSVWWALLSCRSLVQIKHLAKPRGTHTLQGNMDSRMKTATERGEKGREEKKLRSWALRSD